MKQYFLYNHGGSANHGCEALVRTVLSLFKGKDSKITVFSESPQQDFRYNVDKLAKIEPAMTAYSKLSIGFLQGYLDLKLKNDYFKIDSLPYKKPLKNINSNMTELSVGGDIYCYEDYKKFIMLHSEIVKKGCKSVLLGCSLDEKLFKDPLFVADMKRYTYISARESLTYEMLKNAGLTNIGLTPDSAFTLPTEELPLPEGFIEGNTIGINLSPLVVERETEKGIAVRNFVNLINNILKSTDCNIALIPHVVWQGNDDRTVLREIYNEVNQPKRVVLIEDCNCMQLKGFISRCRFFIGARTHATIAAYSSCVPTLVLGYSIKSRGIAKDLFGNDEHYVLPIQNLTEEDSLLKEFIWLWQHEKEIKQKLCKIMPEYIESAKQLKNKVETALELK